MRLLKQELNLKALLLLPLSLSLAVFASVHLYTYVHLDAEYTEEYVDQAFLSAQRVFNAALRSNTDKLSSTLTVISRDERLIQAMLAGNKQALLQRSKPVLDDLRKQYGITHFYFMRPDRSVLLRVHQTERDGDVINRITSKQAETTGKPASGLELGPAGTFTLRTVVPWRDGNRLIGYIELGEEIGYVLDSIRQMLGLDLYVTIQKQYLSQQDWAHGMTMLKRQEKWNYLPGSVIVFQTMSPTSQAIRTILAKDNLSLPATSNIYDGERKYRVNQIPLNDAGGREIGNMHLLRDVTLRDTDSNRDKLLAGGLSFGLGAALIVLFYLVISRVEKRLKLSQLEIKKSEARFRGLVESSSDLIWEIDASACYAYISPKVKDLLGYSPGEMLGKTPFHFMQEEEAARVAHAFTDISAQSRSFQNLENSNRHKDGSIVLLESSGVPILNTEGKLQGYRGVDRDITARKRADKLIELSTQRHSLLFQQTPLAVIEWDINFRVVEWNPAAENIFGYSQQEAIGCHAMDLILPESAKPHVSLIWENLLSGKGGTRSTNENVTRDGKSIYCEWYNTQMVAADGSIIGIASLAQDVTEQKLAAERVSFLAYYDDLTGLPNRALFKDRLSQAFIEADRKERLVGVMFMDIDHFKDVNDTLGHITGNLLLQAVAGRLQGCFRAGDTVARLGGDEFAVILGDMGHFDDAVHIAQQVIENFKQQFFIQEHELFVTFSMGITLYPLDDGDIENLLRNADSAMYAAKASGRNAYQFYASSMTALASQHLAMQTGLRRALELEEFILHYQPQIDCESGRITGVEALVRWLDPHKGIISPAQFIPVAEETGLIVPLGEWILRAACLQAQAWMKQGLPPVRMAVNLSARQFKDPLFSKKVMDILYETGMDPQYLELEVTESILADGLESVSAVLHNFKRAGIRISLDDFGTGYSSLSYLKRFPIDKLKIDQSFVRDVLTDDNDAGLIRAIIAMARALRLNVIAEGVETQAQFDFLRAVGCEEIQGFLIAKPLPAEKVSALFLQSRVQ